MKKQLVLLVGIIFSISALSQVPHAINYQAVYKDASTGIYKKSTVAVIITITHDSPDGIEVFTETHSTSTNENGLFTLQIGSVNREDFSAINWADGPYFLGVNVNGTDFGTSQILSVPYAILAQDVINKDDADADPTNEIQTLSISGHTLSLSDGGDVILPDNVDDADADPTNEIQFLSYSNDSLKISQGNSIYFTTYDPNFPPTLFPQGINHEIIIDNTPSSTFTVPSDKNMYIIRSGWLKTLFDGKEYNISASGTFSTTQYSTPVIPAGTELITGGDPIMYFYADTSSYITPVIFPLNENLSVSYSVPLGKKLIIKSISYLSREVILKINDTFNYGFSENSSNFFPLFPPNSLISIVGSGNVAVGVSGLLIDNKY